MWLKGPCDNEHTELKDTSGTITIQHAFFLAILNLSVTKAIDTSAREIVEVTAATKSNRKNNVDQNRVNGIEENTSGKVTNTSVAPSRLSPSSPNDITAGNIIIPMSMATPKSSTDTVAAVFTRFVFLG